MKVDFTNTEVAFAPKSNADLKKAYILFKTIANPSVVRFGNKMLNIALKIHFPIDWIVKPTIYNHFCGGETIEESNKSIDKKSSFKVKSILDYSVEGKEEEADIQLAFEETVSAIKNAGTNQAIPFCVFKPTAMGRSIVLEKVSQGAELNEQEKKEELAFRRRVHELCQLAYDVDIPILIDAEHTWYQGIIDEVANAEMAIFNKEKAIVFNTFQMYCHRKLDFLKKSYLMAVEGNYHLGAKFVRGAYMESERARAAAYSYENPIQKDKESTDNAYNEALKFCIENIDKISIFNGTHNEYSSQYFADLMEAKGLQNDDMRCWFSQLYGMSDHISFNLGKAGYNVAKYLPYGPIKHVMPYLLRRAEENTSAAGQSGRELTLLTTEVKRRKLNK